RLQPLAELTGEILVIEREPAFIDDEQRWAAIEAIFDAVEEICEHGGRGTRADQALGLERLHKGFAKMLALAVEQPAIGAADAVGPERLFQVVRLKEDGKPGDGALA